MSTFEEDVIVAVKIDKIKIASDAREVKDDLLQLMQKASSSKYDKTLRQVLGNINSGQVTVAQLIDMLRDAIGKADEDMDKAQEKE